MNRFYFVSLFLTAFLLVGFQNCGEVPIERPNRLDSQSPGMGEVKPALAVRAFGCLSCHAKVYGDLITDFGYGDPYFFGLDRRENHDDQYYGPFASKYGSWDRSWRTASVFGNILVPAVNLTDTRLVKAYTSPGTGNPAAVQKLPLAKFMTSKVNFHPNCDPDPKNIDYFIQKVSSPDPEVPGLRGDVKPQKEIYIGAPTEEEISSLSELEGARQVIFKPGAMLYVANKNVRISNLIAAQGSRQRQFYFTNKGTIVCAGDVIIKGVLFLNNAEIETDSGGCRLYVTKSVFIQGPIKVSGNADANLQITSARAVVIGMRSLASRFANDYHVAVTQGMRGAPTDPQELAWNAKVIDDRNKLDDLVNDAGPFVIRRWLDRTQNPPASGPVISIMDDFDDKEYKYVPGIPEEQKVNDCGPWYWSKEESIKEGRSCYNEMAQGIFRKTVNMSHIFLNAPKIHGRYYGTFEGVVVAEDALFAVNHFEFKYDPIFSRVPILPLVGDRILSVKKK